MARGRWVSSSSAIISRSQISPCRNLYLRSEATEERLAGFPAYVSLSRLTTLDSSVASHCRTKLEPINPAPPVTRIGFACIAPELAVHYLAFRGICPASEIAKPEWKSNGPAETMWGRRPRPFGGVELRGDEVESLNRATTALPAGSLPKDGHLCLELPLCNCSASQPSQELSRPLPWPSLRNPSAAVLRPE